MFTEGAGDSSLLSGALQKIGFEQCKSIDEIPESVSSYFPRQFPSDGSKLHRVNSYPEVLRRGDFFVAVIICGGIGNLSAALNNSFLLMRGEVPKDLFIFVDADDVDVQARFIEISNILRDSFVLPLETRENFFGVDLPDEVAEIKHGAINTGIFVWPGGGEVGTLEKVLLEGLEREFPEVREETDKVPEKILELLTEGHPVERALRRGFNIDKAKVDLSAGIICPGTNLNVFLSTKAKDCEQFFEAPLLVRLQGFLLSAFPVE
ncbi:hypothetical protein KUW09_14410 [Mameliella alba]|nr:hypothetical protein [Antarctobacter heliothermus]MBY6145246.1 hypothetical protein [Mameliella alba]